MPVILRGTLLTSGRPGPGGLSVVVQDAWSEACLDGSSNTQEIPAWVVRPAFVWRWRKWRCAGHLLEEVLWPEPPHFRLHFRCLVCGKVFRSKRWRLARRIRREMERWEARRFESEVSEILRKDLVGFDALVTPEKRLAAVKAQVSKTISDMAAVGLHHPPVEIEQDPNEPTLYRMRFSILSVGLPAAAASTAQRITFPAGATGASGPIVLKETP